jgi:NMD protein affecting ribosome stability and mRNA decay
MFEDKNGRAKLEVWYCRGCEAAHISAGNERLSLNDQEFEAFAHAVANIYCESLAWTGPLIAKTEAETKEISLTMLTSHETH